MKRFVPVLSLFTILTLSFGSEAEAAVTAADVAKHNVANGKAVYDANCAACHASGILKAPKTGVKADWAARLPQGMDTMIKKSIDGYTAAGSMPARGGNADLTDQQVSDAVAYMVKSVL